MVETRDLVSLHIQYNFWFQGRDTRSRVSTNTWIIYDFEVETRDLVSLPNKRKYLCYRCAVLIVLLIARHTRSNATAAWNWKGRSHGLSFTEKKPAQSMNVPIQVDINHAVGVDRLRVKSGMIPKIRKLLIPNLKQIYSLG
jgi:hypothetical protein